MIDSFTKSWYFNNSYYFFTSIYIFTFYSKKKKFGTEPPATQKHNNKSEIFLG